MKINTTSPEFLLNQVTSESVFCQDQFTFAPLLLVTKSSRDFGKIISRREFYLQKEVLFPGRIGPLDGDGGGLDILQLKGHVRIELVGWNKTKNIK